MADFSSKQPAPQKRSAESAHEVEGPTPTTGFQEAPTVGLPAKGAGPGVPPSNRKIH